MELKINLNCVRKMYNQKYNTATKAAGVPTGSNHNSQSRVNGASMSGSGSTTNQYVQNNRQQMHSGSGAGGFGNGSNNGGAAGPLRSPPPAELQRRESLVKPTWANISPGQVPSSAFDELVNSANNGAQDIDGYGNGGGGVGGGTTGQVEGEPQSELGMLSNKLLAKNGLNQRQKKREVELYDIFGKVRMLP